MQIQAPGCWIQELVARQQPGQRIRASQYAMEQGHEGEEGVEEGREVMAGHLFECHRGGGNVTPKSPLYRNFELHLFSHI